MKVTQWFPWMTKPVHVGVYQVKTPGNGKLFYRYWTGKHWSHKYLTPNDALSRMEKSCSQDVTWRGLVKSSPSTSQKSASPQVQVIPSK